MGIGRDMLTRLNGMTPGAPRVQGLSDESVIASELARVIRLSRSKVLISAGRLHGDLYDKPQVVDAIRAATARGVEFDVLVGPDPDTNSGAYLLLKNFITQARDVPPLHFAVVDDLHVRIEDEHDQIRSLPPNKLAENVPQIAQKLTEFFYKLKAHLGQPNPQLQR